MTATATPRLVSTASLLGTATLAEPEAPLPAGTPGIAGLLARRLATDPTRPLVTFYDDATGERLEFSAITLDNWVAKTANMLVDTLGLAPGDQIGVALPTHWLALVITLAGWSAGLEVLVIPDGPDGAGAGAGPAPADTRIGALFVAEDRIDATAALAADETVALSLRPMGGRLLRPIPGVLDYATEVPPHGDRFAAPPAPPEQAGLVRAAVRTAASWDLTATDRILCTAAPDTAEGLLGGLLAPLAAGASIVLCRRLDANALDRRAETERVTAVLAPLDAVSSRPGTEADDAAASGVSGWPASPAAVRVLRLPRHG
ncbi:TIGR03089 family protein [Frankia sp. AgKG'84/4]|uniref:TIGR03089 family protein n=1 Tax=Frankia sp. AgKG'84/4 TaxID=573490 RepID=UPI00200D709E|nr:TIGR03089 family protein [Frankia sp. AgKG'84/4]MCL9794794.1 TIGR03089 family protein [Frankia sp. AgKG'84/4]